MQQKTKQPMGFFKTFLAAGLGMFVVGLILTVIFVGLLVSSLTSGFGDMTGNRPVIKENSILHLNFSKEIVDNGPKKEFNFDFNSLESSGKYGLNQLLACIEHAKTDDNIKGIFIDMGSVNAGASSTEAIRTALEDFKKSKKFIYAYGEIYDHNAYYVASVANKVYLFPSGMVQHTGLYTELMFFKGMIDRLDLDVSIIRGTGNKFKSAVEPFLYDKMSEPNRMQLTRILDVVWGHMLEGISKSRGISVADLKMYADSALINDPQAAVDYKLVDKLIYRDELIDLLKKETKTSADKKLRFVNPDKYYSSFTDDATNPLIKATQEKKDKIAVIYATGSIVDGNGDEETIGSITLSAQIRKARLDKSVKAIVLRVNSPGGSALASEAIWRETQLAKKVKPFIVSMGNLAASGGYYISCGADKIYAEHTTLTGSIGVFGILPHTERFFQENTGITFDRVTTHKYSDIGSTTRKMTDDEYKLIQKGVDDIYHTFTLRVSQGRKLDQQLIKDSLGEGRVWMGVDALNLKLVDELGGLDKAISEAAKRAKVKDYIVKNYPEEVDPFQEFLLKLKNESDDDEDNENEVKSSSIKTNINVFAQLEKIVGKTNLGYYQQVLTMLEKKSIQARLPYFIKIN